MKEQKISWSYRIFRKTKARINNLKKEIGCRDFDELFNILLDTYKIQTDLKKERSGKEFDKLDIEMQLKPYFNGNTDDKYDDLNERPSREYIINNYIYHNLFRELNKLVTLKFSNKTVRIYPNYYTKRNGIFEKKEELKYGFLGMASNIHDNNLCIRCAVIVENRLWLYTGRDKDEWLVYDVFPEDILEIYSEKALEEIDRYGLELDIEVRYMSLEELIELQDQQRLELQRSKELQNESIMKFFTNHQKK